MDGGAEGTKLDAPMATFSTQFLGCKVSFADAQAISERLRADGHTEGERGDLAIVNTCCVTHEAVSKSRQAVSKAARSHRRVYVTGCAANLDGAFREVADNVLVVPRVGDEAAAAVAGDVGAIACVQDGHRLERTRAFVKIQDGCSFSCAFCVIPLVRGGTRSRRADAVLAEARRRAEQGHREIVLTGVDISDYGSGLPGEMTLGKLVRQILRHVPELKRLRLSSIDQVEADAQLIAAIAEEPRLMPHLHLSLQAGDNLTLKRMKRRHSRADAVAFCARVRQLRPDIVFGADLIAGFPTETEDMFAGSLQLVDECGLTFLHVFPFSPRPGTPAARMPQVARAVVKERAACLRAKGAAALSSYLEAQVGRAVEVLMERDHLGRTPGFAQMLLAGSAAAGCLLAARVTGSSGRLLQGEPFAPTCAS